MKIILLCFIIYVGSFQLSPLLANTFFHTTDHFIYARVLFNRLVILVPGYYGPMDAPNEPGKADILAQDVSQNSGFLRFVLLQKDSWSKSTYDLLFPNTPGGITIVNFGQYAVLSTNLNNAFVAHPQFLQISIPYGTWHKKIIPAEVVKLD